MFDTAIPLATPVPVKPSKFKPFSTSSSSEQSRKAALIPFCTPGFQSATSASTSRPRPNHDQVIYVSSDSTPSSPGRNALKRDSSDLSIAAEISSPVSKRQRRVPTEGKENALRVTSRINYNSLPTQSTPRPNGKEKTYVDLSSKSLDTLDKLLIYGLHMKNFFSDECLKYHTRVDTDKDIVLLDEIREIIHNRVEAIASTKNGIEADCQDNRLLKPSTSPNMPKTPHIATPPSIFSTVIQVPLRTAAPAVIVAPSADLPAAPRLLSHVPTNNDQEGDLASDDGYWEGMEDISMHDPLEISEGQSSLPTAGTQGGASSLESSSYYPEIKRRLGETFGLTAFRKNQLEAIIAAMRGRDVFVLMPTGGGKSLCYQLPAICTTGETRGVTVVISPLLALMKDQVDSLIRKNVDALLSNSETFGEDWQRLVTNVDKPNLWYITPEKLKDSGKVNDILSYLYQKERLARFVIDEAHCISTWGQDFREAYKFLGSLRERFPSVPIMALTATANQQTVADILSQLKLKDHAMFTQSFNRANLKYIVQKKKKNHLNDIISFIQTRHRDKAGIVYCNARARCEKVATELRENGVYAAYFHAGMDTMEKDEVVHDWQSGRVPVIVATIAFGMGIDKADVRFVIHHDMPKSLSGYYQEIGRAGRDGKPAECVLYYSFQDLNNLLMQIKKDQAATPDTVRRQSSTARDVYQYCDNTSECRRVQLLQHFDEKFDKKNCRQGCDTCEEDRETILKDVTTYTRAIIELVKTLVKERKEKITINQLSSILRGANLADIRAKQHDKLSQYGSCSKMPKELLELMLQRLLYLEVLVKVSHRNGGGFHTEYLDIGPASDGFIAKNKRLILDWHPKADKPLKPRKATAQSISAAPRSRKGKQKAIEDDPIELYDDDSLSLDTFDRFDTPLQDDVPAVVRVAQPESSSSSSQQSAETLYKKMLALRTQIMAQEQIDDETEVFDDLVLQYLSAICPSDYRSFKKEVMNGLDMDEPHSSNITQQKWDQYGQEFLQLCIKHKTGSLKSKPPETELSPALLHSRYEYKSAGPSSKTTPQSSGPGKSKFKPALKS